MYAFTYMTYGCRVLMGKYKTISLKDLSNDDLVKNIITLHVN